MPDEIKRPDPDALLDLIKAEEKTATRGKLKVFFGACAGVGKTYAMLSAAKAMHREGQDVLVGLVETHGREETMQMLEGLPILPKREIDHRGIKLYEFDIDAAIARRPAIILLDELAHSNAPGSRHPKRWQDVEELLQEGIDVYTTLNVQHLESLNDVVARVTGIWVKETVPDAIFDNADDISLIDIPSDELLRRLKEGKVYIAPQAKKRAAQNFFRKSNLIALREVALRRTAERVDAQMSLYNAQQGTGENPLVNERIMVCVGPDPLSERLVRVAKRMSISLKAPWMAVYVENQRHYRLSEEGLKSVQKTLRLVEELGGKTEILFGDDAADAIINFGRFHGVTKIIAGKPHKPKWRDFMMGSLVDALIRKSGNIDIHVVSGEREPIDAEAEKQKPRKKNKLEWKDYLAALISVAGCTGFAVATTGTLDPANILIAYLIGIVVVAVRSSKIPTILTAVASVISFNLVCVEPRYDVSIEDIEFLFAMGCFLLVGLFITQQSSKLRMQAVFSRKREQDITALYAMTRELAATRGQKAMAKVASRHIGEVFRSNVAVWLPDHQDKLLPVSVSDAELELKEETVARWAYDHRQNAGRGTNTLPGARGVYVPLFSAENLFGAIGVIPYDEAQIFNSEQMHLLVTFASLLGSSLERAKSAESAEKAKIEAESEKLRNILLGSFAE